MPELLASQADPERVLTIASHVVFGYVGNSVTTFVLQALGLEVSALNTVQFSNHTGYKKWTGSITTPELIGQLWEGLKSNEVVEEYGMLLTGYVPGAKGVEAVGAIGKELKKLKKCNGRDLFWLLDPVMGDSGKLYVSEDVVPIYKALVPHADLITPNQFEAELLCGIKVQSLASLSHVIDTLHSVYHVPHVVVTSVTFSKDSFNSNSSSDVMICAGSTLTSTCSSRKFILPIQVIPGDFSGTGDMFAALTLARLRDEAELAGLLGTTSWISPDNVPPTELPLAKALENVLGSMRGILERTRAVRDKKLASMDLGKDTNVRTVKASELQLVKGQRDLLYPGNDYKALPFDVSDVAN